MDQVVFLKNYCRLRFPFWGNLSSRLDHSLWNNANFRLFLMSECAGIFGSHFYQIALPWLVMEFTGSAGAMGTSIIISGASRMALMMVGGTLADRFSPRRLIFAASALRALLLVVLTGCMLMGRMDLLVLYGFSLATGLTDAIFMPARGSAMPMLVDQELLKAANAIAAAQEKLWGLIGPTMAGLFITWMNSLAPTPGPEHKSFLGPTVAFVINILALGISVMILRPAKFAISTPAARDDPEGLPSPAHGGSLRELVTLIWNQAGLRVSFLMVYSINTLSSGPLYIGLPMLAVSRFPVGAQALGFLTSAIGCGALLGTLLAGVLPQPKPHQMGRLFLVVAGILGAGLAVLIGISSVIVDITAVLILAALISYVNVTGTAQVQRQTPPAFMGRMMGLLNMK